MINRRSRRLHRPRQALGLDEDLALVAFRRDDNARFFASSLKSRIADPISENVLHHRHHDELLFWTRVEIQRERDRKRRVFKCCFHDSDARVFERDGGALRHAVRHDRLPVPSVPNVELDRSNAGEKLVAIHLHRRVRRQLIAGQVGVV